MSSRILAVDYGERRIGLAVSDPGRIVATPLTTLDTRRFPDVMAEMVRLVREQEAGLVLVGYPLHLDGRQGDTAPAVDAFVAALGHALPGIEIRKVDERYSSVEAESILSCNVRSRKQGRPDKKAVDRVAAAVILQEFLNRA